MFETDFYRLNKDESYKNEHLNNVFELKSCLLPSKLDHLKLLQLEEYNKKSFEQKIKKLTKNLVNYGEEVKKQSNCKNIIDQPSFQFQETQIIDKSMPSLSINSEKIIPISNTSTSKQNDFRKIRYKLIQKRNIAIS